MKIKSKHLNLKGLKILILSVMMMFLGLMTLNCQVAWAAPAQTEPDLSNYPYTAKSFYTDARGITWSYTYHSPKQGTHYGIATDLYIDTYQTNYSLETITIPDKIGDFRVVEVVKNPDEEKNTEIVSKIKKIIFSDTLEYIGEGVFENCINLENISFDSATALKYVGTNAFKGCTSLTEVNLSEELMNIMCEGVFENCTGIKEVTIEGSSPKVPGYTFNGCSSLAKINLSEEVTKFSCSDYAFSNCAFEELIFNATVEIREGGFSKNGRLKKVIFNGSNTELGTDAFSNSFYADEEVEGTVEINSKYTTLGASCFYRCSGLVNMSISENSKNINFDNSCIGYSGIKNLIILGYDVTCAYGCFSFAGLEELKFECTNKLSFYGDLFFRHSANETLKSVEIDSNYVIYNPHIGDSATYTDPFSSAVAMESLVFGKNVCNITGYVNKGVSGSDANYAKYSRVYLWNPKVRVDFTDTTPHAYTIYGYNYRTSEFYDTDCFGMYSWKKGCGENKDGATITCENIQTKLTASYDNEGCIKNGVTLVEGQSVNLDYLMIQQRYMDGSVASNAKKADGTCDIEYSESDMYAGYVLKYGDADNNRLKVGKNLVEVYYGDLTSEVIVNAVAKQVTDFTLTYVGETKIEGQTVSKEDFKVTNVTYNDKEVVEEVLDFEVTGLDKKLEKGKTIFQVSYGGVTKEFELEVAEKKLSNLEITQKDITVVKYVGDVVSVDDFLVTAIYNNGDKTENFIGFSIKDGTLVEENTELEFIVGDVHVPYNFHATPVVATNIQAAVADGVTAVEHGKIDTSILTVTAGLNNGKKVELSAEEYQLEPYNIVAGKVNTITVKYQGLTTTFNITGVPASICALEVTSIQNVTADVPKKTYFIGDKVTKDDLIVTAIYNNGLKEANFTDYTITKDTLTHNISTIVVALNSNPEVTGECEVLANDVVLEKIEVVYTGGDIQEGLQVDKEAIKVTAYYSNGETKEVAAENYTIKDYAIVNGVKTTITVVYNGKEASFDIKGLPAPTPTATPEPTATPTPTTAPESTAAPESTVVPELTTTPELTVAPELTATPELTTTPKPTVIPTITAKPTVTNKPTATPKPSSNEGKFTFKSNNKKVKLQSKSAKTTYKIYTKKAIKLTVSQTGNGKVYYQIVKKGSKLNNKKWTLAKKQIVIKKDMKACVYVKYTQNGKTVIKKTKGFVFDKTAPKISVSKSCKLSVKDSGSGVKKITVDGKKVKNGVKLSTGIHKVVAYDKAGNKKTVKVTIKK